MTKVPLSFSAYTEQPLFHHYDILDGVGIDVGCFNGDHTLAMAERMARVYAFEPNPVSRAAAIARVMHASPRAVVKIEAYGVSSAEEEVPFRCAGGQSRIGGSKSLSDFGADTNSTIRCVTLDNYCGGFDRLDIVKIDVEGRELDVLRGAEQTLARLSPQLLIENHEDIEPGYGSKWDDITGWLYVRGYEPQWELTHNGKPLNVLFEKP